MSEPAEKGFLARMFSDDPTASSQRVIGVLGFIVAVVFAALSVKAYYDFLWFCAVMFGVKEIAKVKDILKKPDSAGVVDKPKTTPAAVDKKPADQKEPAKAA